MNSGKPGPIDFVILGIVNIFRSIAGMGPKITTEELDERIKRLEERVKKAEKREWKKADREG
jgi:hypothetical protein